jgi:ribose transport system permease protein
MEASASQKYADEQQEGSRGHLVKGKRDTSATRILVSLAPYLLLIVVAVAMTVGDTSFLSPLNLETLAVQASGLLVMAVGVTFVVLMGSIDISFAEVANFVSVVLALGITNWGLGFWAFPLALLVGVFAGWLNGVLLVWGRIPSLVATLGTMGMWTGLAYVLSGGPPVEMHTHQEYLSWITSSTFGLPNEMLIALAVTLASALLLRFTWFGRSIYAIGAGERVAHLSGITVKRFKIMAFVVGGMCAAIGGIILSGRVKAGAPVLSAGYLLYVLAAIVVGGTALTGGVGGAIRTLVGALIITMLRNGMNVVGVDAFAQQVVLGAVLIVAVAVTIDRSKIPIIK